MSERDLSSRSFSSLACLAVRTLKNSVSALETLPSSPRMETSSRPVLMVRERSEICFSCGNPSDMLTCWPRRERSGRPAMEEGGRVAGSSTHQGIGLPDFIGRLLQPPLRRVDPPVALVNVLLHVPHVVVLEPVLALVRRALVFRFQRLAVHFRAGAEVLLGVGEEVVRAGAGEEGAADFRVRDGELGMARGGSGAHELL